VDEGEVYNIKDLFYPIFTSNPNLPQPTDIDLKIKGLTGVYSDELNTTALSNTKIRLGRLNALVHGEANVNQDVIYSVMTSKKNGTETPNTSVYFENGDL
jgi:hypothetical protein